MPGGFQTQVKEKAKRVTHFFGKGQFFGKGFQIVGRYGKGGWYKLKNLRRK